MTAQVRNSDGDVLDSVDITKTGKKKVKFKFGKEEALGGDKKAEVTIVFTDTNGDKKNFQKNPEKIFDLDPNAQTFTTVIKQKNKKVSRGIKLAGTRIDNQPPVFTSGNAVSVDENINAGSPIYLATATDKSGPIDFTLSGPDAGAFSIATVTNFSSSVSINSSPDFEEKPSYSFNVDATDAKGNSSSQSVSVSINNLPDTGETITLTNFQDVYSSNIGTVVNENGVQTERSERFTNFDDTINGAAGTLGVNTQLDSLTDPSTSDNDTLNLATNNNNDLQTSLATGNLTNLTNVEKLVVNAINDNSNNVDFSQVTELQTLDLDGFFQQDVQLTNYIDTALINNFDFSDSTNTAIGFVVQNANNNEDQTTEPLNFLGSPGGDTFEANIGAATMRAGAGDDELKGSTSNSTYVAGQTGTDTIELIATNAATDIVSYQDIETDNNANNVANFVAFLDTTNNPTQNEHDKLEFDADTVTNFNAGVTVQQKTFAQLEPLLGTPAADNHMLVDADPDNQDLSQHGKSWVALDNVNGELFYSQDGNFAANAELIGTITFVNNDPAEFLSRQNVTVIA